ncbi:hypothetical protein MMC13_004804 [Lambiella insularis]|nr:hypothetical protein [Lambiella insularis]
MTLPCRRNELEYNYDRERKLSAIRTKDQQFRSEIGFGTMAALNYELGNIGNPTNAYSKAVAELTRQSPVFGSGTRRERRDRHLLSGLD